MTETKIIAGNWKMNLGVSQSRELAKELVNNLDFLNKTSVWIAPSSTAIMAVNQEIQDSKIQIGCQNIHWEQKGAFTGEISVAMAQELGCTFSLTGHSERRHLMGESNQQITQRTIFGLKENFKVILCIGETLAEREAEVTHKILQDQLEPILSRTSQDSLNNLIIAYEPVWAIGTGKVASALEIEDAHQAIHMLCSKYCPAAPPILYGGSVSPDNFSEIVRIPNVSGALVGGASLVAEKFLSLVKIAESAA